MNPVDLIRREPVRVYVYGLVAALLAALGVLGYVKTDLVPVILALVAAALAVPAVEVARSKVEPTNKP